MNSWKALIEKHHGAIGIALFVFTVIFTHAPFFLFIPVPGINMDTFNYYWFAKEIFDGKLPVIDQPHDFPWGYPFFLFMLKKFGANIQIVAFVQTLVYTICGAWLIRQFAKSLSWGGIIAGVSLLFFTLSPFTIRHNLTLYMESLYTSSLFIVAGGVVLYSKEKSVKSFGVILLGVLAAMLIRPNGVTQVLVPVLALVFAYLNRLIYKPYVFLLLAMFAFNIAGNLVFKGKISFGDSNRIEKVANNFKKKYFGIKVVKDGQVVVKKKVVPYENTAKGMFIKYFSNFVSPKPSYYYSLMPTNYNLVVQKKMPDNEGLKMFDNRFSVDTFSPGLRNFLFEGFSYEKYNSAKYADVIDYDKKTSKMMFASHFVFQMLHLSKFFYAVYLLFWMSVFYAAYQFFIAGNRDELYWLILMLSVIHFVSLFLLPFIHGRFQLRYIHVSEFLIYINALLGLAAYFTISRKEKTQLN